MSAAGGGSSLQWIRQVQSRLAQHLQHKSTDLMTATVQSSLADKLYFASERDDVARAAPAFVLPSCLLPPGHVVADYLPSTKTPILIHRDEESNMVRAYRNQCRHRGAALIPSSANATVTSPRRLKGWGLTCPYHAWTYDVRNGHLKKIPGEKEGFPCLDKTTLGLESIACTETAGGIWVDGEQLLERNLWSFQEIDQELKELWLDLPSKTQSDDTSNRLVGFREWRLQANWQLLVETFLESYHVQFLHQDTLGLVTHGNCMVVDHLDTRSLRHTVPLSNFDVSQPQEVVSPKDSFFSQTTTTYFLFPNVAISLFKRFAMFLVILPEQPQSGNNSSSDGSLVRAWAVTHGTAVGEEVEKQQRDLESIFNGIEEDWQCAEEIQRGLNPNTQIQHGRFEGNNIDFLRHVGELSKIIKR